MVGPVAVRCPRTSRAQAGTWMTWGGDCSSAFGGAAFVALAGTFAFGGASPVAAAESLAGLADELECYLPEELSLDGEQIIIGWP